MNTITWVDLMDILTHPHVRITLPGGYKGFVDMPVTSQPVPDSCLLMMMCAHDDSDEPYCALNKAANEEVNVEGNRVWIISHIGASPVPLVIHRVWLVESDPDLVRAREKRRGDERRAYENQFVRGAKFRVIRAGAFIEGTTPIAPNTEVGYREGLPIGTILQCAGESMTYGDGVPAIKWLREDGRRICNDALFSPVQGGTRGGQIPERGWVELVTDQTSAS